MPSVSELQYSRRADRALSESSYVGWVRQLGWRFPILVVFGFLGVTTILALPSLGAWEEAAAILLAPALLLLIIFGGRQAWQGICELRHKLVWWHGLWFLILVSSLVFRIRDAAEAQALPIDGYATLRVLPEVIVGLYLLIHFLRKGSTLQRSFWQGLAGAMAMYGLISLTSVFWSVKPSWTLYKSAEFLLDVSVLAAVLATVESVETYKDFFNWTLILCGVELLWTWIGAVIWPAEALHSTYPERLVGVFPIQSANAIGASGAVLSIVALCRLLPLANCRFQRSWNILLFAFGVASMVACRTRAALAGFGVALLLVMVFSRRARRAAIVAAGVLLAGYTLALLFNAAPQPGALWNHIASPSGEVLSFLERGQNQDQLESLTGRMEWWRLAWQQFMTHPVTGLGAYAGGKFGVLSKMGLGDTPQLHSDYLETLVGTSFWGLIPLVVALLGTWWLLIRFVRSPSLQPFERQLALEAIGVLGVITVRSFVNVELIWHAPQFFLAVLGYAELLRRRAKAGRLASQVRVIASPLPWPEKFVVRKTTPMHE
jgi:hypothetical protein